MDETGQSRLRMMVSGRVQGVGFRFFVVECAQNLGIKGWVRNTWDGKVELAAEGPRTKLEILRESVRQGPPSSFVTDVQESWEPAGGQFSRFYVASSS